MSRRGGRPEIGPEVRSRLPRDVLDQLDGLAKLQKVTRAQLIREGVLLLLEYHRKQLGLPVSPTAGHDCGLCDGPLTYTGGVGEYATWRCGHCGWLHASKDCCEDAVVVHPGSRACATCLAENPEQFVTFPTICPHARAEVIEWLQGGAQ